MAHLANAPQPVVENGHLVHKPFWVPVVPFVDLIRPCKQVVPVRKFLAEVIYDFVVDMFLHLSRFWARKAADRDGRSPN